MIISLGRRLLPGVALALALLSGVARAQAPALSFVGYTPAWEYTQDSYSIGWYLGVNSPVSVSALGWYNDSDGLSSSHPVGIYDIAAKGFIAATLVGTGDPLIAQFRYHDLVAPVALAVGRQYAVVGVSYKDHYISFAPASGIATDSAISFLGGAIDYAGGATALVPPVDLFPGGSYWPATNLKIAPTPAGTIASLTPNTAQVNSPGFNVTVTGSGFDPNAFVRFNSTALSTVSHTSTQIVAQVPASLLTSVKTYNVTVVNAGKGSNVLPFKVTRTAAGPSLQIVGNFRTGRDPLSGTMYAVLLLQNTGTTDITNLNFNNVVLSYGAANGNPAGTLIPLGLTVEPGASPAGNLSRTAPGELLQLRWDFTPNIANAGTISIRGTSDQGGLNAGSRFLLFP